MNINETEFKELLERNDNVVYVVDFWAEWCGPCRIMGPILQRISDGPLANDDGAKILKLNVDEVTDREMLSNMGIRSIPTLAFFKNGEEVTRLIGVQQEGVVLGKIEECK